MDKTISILLALSVLLLATPALAETLGTVTIRNHTDRNVTCQIIAISGEYKNERHGAVDGTSLQHFEIPNGAEMPLSNFSNWHVFIWDAKTGKETWCKYTLEDSTFKVKQGVEGVNFTNWGNRRMTLTIVKYLDK